MVGSDKEVGKLYFPSFKWSAIRVFMSELCSFLATKSHKEGNISKPVFQEHFPWHLILADGELPLEARKISAPGFFLLFFVGTF